MQLVAHSTGLELVVIMVATNQEILDTHANTAKQLSKHYVFVSPLLLWWGNCFHFNSTHLFTYKIISMLEKFDQTAIVIVEITEEGKAIETQYVTIGVVGKNIDKCEIGIDALNYVNATGKKKVKEIIIANNEQYRTFLETNFASFVKK